ncbi:MAG: DNA polymerase III subunit gamma/tau, partial [Enterobacteriaceae bacterium]
MTTSTSYQVLARKWRPQTFAAVVGQQHVLKALTNSLTMGRIHHAYLFSGTRGVGKTSIARLLAKGLNCETGITATPCGECASCQEIEQGRFVDLIEIDAASRTKVEDTRELLDNVQYAPTRGRFKIYLIDEVHMLSRHSFNALLKTLEEPPEHVKFLLATTDPQKLPITILSRCLQFHLKALDIDLIRQQLDKVLSAEAIPSEPRALQLLARAADGSMRDALSLTDQAIALGEGQVTTELVTQMLGVMESDQPLLLLEALVSGEGEAVMSCVQHIASLGVEWQQLLVELMTLLHRIAMIQLLPAGSSEIVVQELQHEERLRELARIISPADVQLYYQILLLGRKELEGAPDRRMGVEMCLLRVLAFHPVQAQRAEIATPAPLVAPAPVQAAVPPVAPATPVQAGQGDMASVPLSSPAASLLQAKSQIQRVRQEVQTKKSEPAAASASQPVNSTLQRVASMAERIEATSPAQAQAQTQTTTETKTAQTQKAYRWQARNSVQSAERKTQATPQAVRSALEYEKTPELAARLIQESTERDPWAAQVEQLKVPKLVQQLALNAFREQKSEQEICL